MYKTVQEIKRNLIDDLLKMFYKDIHAVVFLGETQKWFYPKYGLCSNLNFWIYYNQLELDSDIADKICWSLSKSFEKAGLNREYPFNNGDGDDYSYEMDNNLIYTNQNRLDWIKNHA